MFFITCTIQLFSSFHFIFWLIICFMYSQFTGNLSFLMNIVFVLTSKVSPIWARWLFTDRFHSHSTNTSGCFNCQYLFQILLVFHRRATYLVGILMLFLWTYSQLLSIWAQRTLQDKMLFLSKQSVFHFYFRCIENRFLGVRKWEYALWIHTLNLLQCTHHPHPIME